MKKQLLMEMFQEMVVKKNHALVERYYHADFVLETNGQRQHYASFAEGHRRVYATEITYEIRFYDDSWVEAADKLAARIWITTKKSDEKAVEIEVVLVATMSETCSFMF